MQSEGWNLEHTYANLPEIFYRNQKPVSAPTPKMVIFNDPLAKTLGLDAEKLKTTPDIFAGNKLPPGAKPISQAYAGYQFGHFAMLGDGRAVLLGEQVTPNPHKVDIQLKGSGPTPFSRGGDGYAALLPMLREYIISEAMFSLGIPTTRSLAVVLTGKDVIREKVLQGAVLTRVASSHIRVGTFDYIAAFGTEEDIRTLADYSIQRHFPNLAETETAENKYILFLREVAKLQASLISSWQLVGFVHGVMNTDNMAISGETIDFGPCAFMDTYDPGTVFSSIDNLKRYSYKNQPKIGAWNLSRLAESLLPLLHENEDVAIKKAKSEIEYYWKCYNENWLKGMYAKLGIVIGESEDATLEGAAPNDATPKDATLKGATLEGAAPNDASFINELLDLMAKHKLDYTNTFRALSFPPATSPLEEMPPLEEVSPLEEVPSLEKVSPLEEASPLEDASPLEEMSQLNKIPEFIAWHKKWQSKLDRQLDRQKENPWDLMKKRNPAVIPRNHRVEEALAAAERGDLSVMHNLLSALNKPYEDSAKYAQPPAPTGCEYKTFCGT